MIILILCAYLAQSVPLIYFPLDERFATRGQFLQESTLAPFTILTPPIQYLSKWRSPGNLPLIDQWFTEALKENCLVEKCTVIMSVEDYIYGGLINSRISNDSLNFLKQRFTTLKNLHEQYQFETYISVVIMRIPSYSANFEEPLYYDQYGAQIFQWSSAYDECMTTKQAEPCQRYKLSDEAIPDDIKEDYSKRRQRNFEFTMFLLENSFFKNIWVTLDDSSPWGFNRREKVAIQERVHGTPLQNIMFMYPGADEVGLIQLARATTNFYNIRPAFHVVYRNENTKSYIPAYEGVSLNESVLNQINAAGGYITSKPSENDIILLINNFDELIQREASEVQTNANYSEFDKFISQQVFYADVRFANGADLFLIDYLKDSFTLMTCGYAGWNTAGNTLGSAVSNSILLTLTKQFNANAQFQLYRFTEDAFYQSETREELKQYISKVNDNQNDLSNDLDFYQKFSEKLLNSRLQALCESLKCIQIFGQLPSVTETFYPWTRTFEIGFNIAI